MAIIIEGFDGSGKSTLASALSSKLKMYNYHVGPHPESQKDILACLDRQQKLMKHDVIIDRVTCISEAVYHDKMHDEDLAIARKNIAEDSNSIIIYCRPTTRNLVDLSNHQLKDYDSEESIQFVIDNMHEIIRRYDTIFENLPHIRYDFTDDQIDLKWLADELYMVQNVPGHKDELLERLSYDDDPLKP